MANHVQRRGAMVRHPEARLEEGWLDQAGCPGDRHQPIFGLLREPSSNCGSNHKTGVLTVLWRIAGERGRPACPEVIRKITKAAGYRWRKARVVLASSDPDYTAKVDRIRSILSGLRPDEAFFSIDEFGPFAVKMKPGRALCAPGEQRIVPQRSEERRVG